MAIRHTYGESAMAKMYLFQSMYGTGVAGGEAEGWDSMGGAIGAARPCDCDFFLCVL